MSPQTIVKEPALRKETASLPGPPQKVSLVDIIPPKLVMLLAAPYMAGKTAIDALAKSQTLFRDSQFCSTIDILGEDAKNDADCEESVQNYKNLIDMVASSPVPCSRKEQQTTVSFKPSMFCTVVPGSTNPQAQKQLDKAYERIESIVKHAQEKNIRVTLEAEDHNWTDFHIDTYISLIEAGYLNLGTVLQARLFRTKNDLQRFDERMRVRMVIGIYNEPAAIALTEKPMMKAMAVEYAAELLKRGVYVELATHDSDCLKSFIQNAVVPQNIPASQFEIQYLLGVPRKQIQQALVSGEYFTALVPSSPKSQQSHLAELARSGTVVRMYLPYGTEHVAGPYCKRRLKANPNMISYGIKNLFHIQ